MYSPNLNFIGYDRKYRKKNHETNMSIYIRNRYNTTVHVFENIDEDIIYPVFPYLKKINTCEPIVSMHNIYIFHNEENTIHFICNDIENCVFSFFNSYFNDIPLHYVHIRDILQILESVGCRDSIFSIIKINFEAITYDNLYLMILNLFLDDLLIFLLLYIHDENLSKFIFVFLGKKLTIDEITIEYYVTFEIPAPYASIIETIVYSLGQNKYYFSHECLCQIRSMVIYSIQQKKYLDTSVLIGLNYDTSVYERYFQDIVNTALFFESRIIRLIILSCLESNDINRVILELDYCLPHIIFHDEIFSHFVKKNSPEFALKLLTGTKNSWNFQDTNISFKSSTKYSLEETFFEEIINNMLENY